MAQRGPGPRDIYIVIRYKYFRKEAADVLFRHFREPQSTGYGGRELIPTGPLN